MCKARQTNGLNGNRARTNRFRSVCTLFCQAGTLASARAASETVNVPIALEVLARICWYGSVYVPFLVGTGFELERCSGVLVHFSPFLAKHLADVRDLHVRIPCLDLYKPVVLITGDRSLFLGIGQPVWAGDEQAKCGVTQTCRMTNTNLPRTNRVGIEK